MTRTLLLAIDQGTSNTKAVLVDEGGGVVGAATRPVSRRYPQPGWVEQDPRELWESVDHTVREVLTTHPQAGVAAMALTNQRESVMAWDRSTGEPMSPCVSWQCRRTADMCQELRAEGVESLIRQKTGLPIDPLFSASKMAWLLTELDLRASAHRGDVCLGTVDSWLLWNLTGGAVHAVEVGNASRTQLLDIHRVAWDEELLEIFHVPVGALPTVNPSVGHHGDTSTGGPVPAGTPILAVAADSHAALYGHGCFQPGAAKATYGTGTSLMTPTATPSTEGSGLATTIAWQQDTIVYATEANITATGATISWLCGLLGLSSTDELHALASESGDDTDGVYLVPGFAGLGAPYWDDTARGLITGLTFGSGPAQLARAAVESIAFQVRDVVEAFQDGGDDLSGPLRADGGAASNDLLMQFQADLLGRPVRRAASSDLAVLGVARLAATVLGRWSEDEEATASQGATLFEPTMGEEERHRRCEGWRSAVARSLDSGAAMHRLTIAAPPRPPAMFRSGA